MIRWEKIPGYEDYMISTEGEIKSLKGKNERLLTKIKGSKKNNGMDKVKLYKNGVYRTMNVSTLMGIVFLGRKEGQMTRHKNKNPHDYKLENLYIQNVGV